MSFVESSYVHTFAAALYDWSLNILRTIVTNSKSVSTSLSSSSQTSLLSLSALSLFRYCTAFIGSYIAYAISIQYYSFKTSSLRSIPGPVLRNNFWYGNFFELVSEAFLEPHKRWYQELVEEKKKSIIRDSTEIKDYNEETLIGEKDDDRYIPVMAYSGLFGKFSVVVLDPNLVRDILCDPTLSSNNIQYMKRYALIKLLLGDGLVALEGTDWSRHRRIIQPAFQTSLLEHTLNHVVPLLTNQLIQSWIKANGGIKDNGNDNIPIIDLDTHLQALTLDVIGQAGFSYEFNALDAVMYWSNLHSSHEGISIRQQEQNKIQQHATGTKEYNHMMKSIGTIQINHPFVEALNKRLFGMSLLERLLLALNQVWLLPYCNPFISYRQYKVDSAAEKIVLEAKEKLLLQQQQQPDDNSIPAATTTSSSEVNGKDVILNTNKSLLELLLQASSSESSRNTLSLKELRDEVKTFLLAGHETTQTWCYWALYVLSKDPNIQEKLYQNIIKHSLPTTDQDGNTPIIHLQQVNDMDYLEAFLSEVLRYYPPVGVLFRYNTKPVKWHQHNIPANTRIVIPMYMLHHHPLYWGSDAHRFDPDRWLKKNEENGKQHHTYHPYTFLPFSLGLRNCIGYRFAQIEAKLIIANIVRQCKILSPSCMPNDITLTTIITMKSKPGVKIHIQERKENK